METNTNTASVRAFTLLIAMILSAIALSVGATLAHISKKQLSLSMTAQDSGVAFYTASSALDCVTAADQLGNGNWGGSPFSNNPTSVTIPCRAGDEWVQVVFTRSYTDPAIGSVFVSSEWRNQQGGSTDWNGWFPIGKGCAHLTVAKNDTTGRTRLYARGINVCDFSWGARIIERGASAKY